MEVIFSIIGIYILFYLGSLVFHFIIAAIGAAGKSAISDQSFGEAFRGVPDFKVELEESFLEGYPDEPKFNIKVRGLLPITCDADLSFVTIIHDVTEKDNRRAVFSLLDSYQEEGSVIYFNKIDMGHASLGSGFTDWASVSCFYPSMLQYPRGGKRKLSVQCMLVNSDNPPVIMFGMIVSEGDIYNVSNLITHYVTSEKGYEDVSDDKEEAEELMVGVGVAIAMADGILDDSEGEAIKEWIKKTVSSYGEDRAEILKERYNLAFKHAYSEALNNDLKLSDIANRLNEIGDKAIKQNALNLAYLIMTADGVADPSELRNIRLLGETLEIDVDEVEKIKSRHLINLTDAFSEEDSLDEMLGIDSSWSDVKIKKHLAREFQKWNGRYTSLPQGDERENAQQMLNRIGQARAKYNA